ncbi:MAG: Hint domain-containing protein [Paracoccaceae bacterium]
MSEKTPANAPTSQSLPVYCADDFRVTNGANLGDPITDATEMALDDVYGLRASAQRIRLAVSVEADRNHFTIAQGTEAGEVGAKLYLDCCATFMCPDGVTVEAIILVETEGDLIATSYLLPLAPFEIDKDYALVKVDRRAAASRFAEVACVSFTRGTLITLANGMQKPIEELALGDKVLTRDNGPREIRWIGQQTVRATGAFAPIVIRKGVLNNENDLTLSPNHRLFIYQRRDHLRAGRAEVMVKARLLVNGETVVQSDGGYVDYFQLMFDSHEIIYAEGIAAESLFVDTRVKSVLPRELREQLAGEGHETGRAPRAFELNEATLDSATAADLLRRASSC